MLVSVIVPVYGVEKYLSECINSIIGQTYEELEIILVDDGSLDSCPQICDDYALKDQRIHVVHKDNGGLVSARKAGIKRATGEYVLFVDGDDTIVPDMIEKMVQEVMQHQVDIVSCDFFSNGNASENLIQTIPVGVYQEEDFKTVIMPKLIFSGKYYEYGIFPMLPVKLFRRSLIEPYILQTPDKITLGEDAAISYSCMINGCSVSILGNQMYFYRRYDESMTLGYRKEQIKNTIVLIEYLKQCIDKNNMKTELLEQLKYYICLITESNLCNCRLAGANSDAQKQCRCDMKEFIHRVGLRQIIHSCDMSIVPLKSRILLWMAGNGMLDIILLYQKVCHKI